MPELSNEQIEVIVDKTVSTMLSTFGINEVDRVELQADFHHLRRWRKSVEQVQGFTFKAIITVIVSGVVGALWLGFKISLGK